MNRYHVISIFFIALLLFVSFQILKVLSSFFVPLFWAAILAFALYPVYLKLKTALKGREFWAALIMTLVIVLALVPFVIVVVANLIEETRNFYTWVSTSIQTGQFEQWINQLLSSPWMHNHNLDFIDWETIKTNLKAWASNSATAMGKIAAAQIAVITKNVFQFVINLFLAIFFLFFFFKDGDKIFQFIYDLTPLEEANKRDIYSQINATLTAVIHGQLLSAFIQAIVAGTIFGLMGLPFPLLLGTLTFFLALIPLMGAPIVWFPLVVYLAIQQEYMRAAVLFGLGSLVIGSVDNIVHPFLIGQRTKLPYLLLLLGIIGGLQVYGIIGIFIGPTLMSLFFVLIKIYREKFMHHPITEQAKTTAGPIESAKNPIMNKSTVSIQVMRRFDVPAEKVFDAWLDPKSAGQWLFKTPTGKMVRVDIDAKVGGTFYIVEQRGETKAEHMGKYLTIERPRRLAFTFGVPGFPETPVTIDIKSLPDGCELTLTHDQVLAEYQEKTKQGWVGILEGLAATLK